MAHGKHHDIWRGSLIESFDTWTPLEPKKPPRPFEGNVDVRYEHRHRKEREGKEALLQLWRSDYLGSHGEANLAELEECLRTLRQGQLVHHVQYGYGVVTGAPAQTKGKENIRVKFSGKEKSKKIAFPGAFYVGTLTFVEESQKIRDEHDLHLFEPKKQQVKPSAERPPKAGGITTNAIWGLEKGMRVSHSVYGEGNVIVAKEEFVKVRFWNRQTRTFRPSSSLERMPLKIVETTDSDRYAVTGKATSPLPSKGPKLRVVGGRLTCPVCGYAAESTDFGIRCPKCVGRRKP